jgi:RNA methyltransferase, TrmH family
MSNKAASRAASPFPERLRRVEGRHNPLLKELRGAFAHGELTEGGACAIEGVRIIEEAVRSGLRFRAVFFSESARGKAERLLPQIGSQVETLILPDKLFSGAVPSETPQGVAALVRVRKRTLENVLERPSPLLAIVGIQDPGNLGTILRSAEAFEAGGVLLGEGTVSAFNSKVVRASAGSVFRLPAVRVKMESALALLRQRSFRLIATSSHKGSGLEEANLSGNIALFIGSEGAGIGRELLGQMDEIVAIPHSPKVESLNAGVAASIVLYERSRQRKEAETNS